MNRIPSSAAPDVQQSFRDVWSTLDTVIGARNINLGGRRVVNAGGAVDDGDYLTKADLKNAAAGALPGVSRLIAQASTGGAAANTVIVGTHAERLAIATVRLSEGTLFLETDRTAIYRLTSNVWLMAGSFSVFDFLANRPTDLQGIDTGFLFMAADQGVLYRWTGLVWVYMAGILRGLRSARPLPGNCDTGMIFQATDQGGQAWIKENTSNDWVLLQGWGDPLSGTLPPSVSPVARDAGFRYRSTDFDRVYRWTGSAWEDAPGEPRRGMMVFAMGALGTGWVSCDGSSVTGSTASGGTTAVTVPNFVGLFPRANSSSGGTGGASGHTHSVDPPNTSTGGASAVTTSGPSAVTTSGPSRTVEVDDNLDGTTIHVASEDHDHDLNHTHDLSHFHDVDIAPFTSGSASSLPPYQDAFLMYRL